MELQEWSSWYVSNMWRQGCGRGHQKLQTWAFWNSGSKYRKDWHPRVEGFIIAWMDSDPWKGFQRTENYACSLWPPYTLSHLISLTVYFPHFDCSYIIFFFFFVEKQYWNNLRIEKKPQFAFSNRTPIGSSGRQNYFRSVDVSPIALCPQSLSQALKWAAVCHPHRYFLISLPRHRPPLFLTTSSSFCIPFRTKKQHEKRTQNGQV